MGPVLSTDGNYAIFVVSVDDLEWTKHWLGRLYCDLLLVSVARLPDLVPKIHIRAVESKTTSNVDPIEPGPKLIPFAEGIQQVVSTIEALNELIAPESPYPLVEDLRYASFIEHLTSIALSDLYPLMVTDQKGHHVVRMISDLSLRRLQPNEVFLDGAVVCTQFGTAVSRRVAKHSEAINGRTWPILLIRTGSTDIDSLVGTELASLKVDVESSDAAAPPTVPSPEKPPTPPGLQDTKIEESAHGPEETLAEQPATPEQQLAEDLFLACRHRGIPVQQPEFSKIVVGPAVVSISMAVQAGASIRVIEAAAEDLAREVGVKTLSVENDPNLPYHLRFLVARREREFVPLPDEVAPLVEPGSQSYLGLFLGRTIDGKDFLSYVSSWPHMLVGGTTGSGKTTFIRSLLLQIGRIDSQFVKVAIVDGKGEIDYHRILPPEYFASAFPEVVLGHQHALAVLDWVVQTEMPARRNVVLGLANATPDRKPRSARDLFVESVAATKVHPFPPLLIVIDEFAEIMRGPNAQAFEGRVQQVTQVGRSVLVHLLLATQRPDATVVRGAIKANLDARIALRLPTHHDSMTILGGKGAETLLGQGDLIFQAAGQPPVRLQGYNALGG